MPAPKAKILAAFALITTMVISSIGFGMGSISSYLTQEKQTPIDLSSRSKAELPNPLMGILLAVRAQQTPTETLAKFKKLLNSLQANGINFIIFDMHWSNFKFQSLPQARYGASDKPLNREIASQMSAMAKDMGFAIGVHLNFLSHQSYGLLLKTHPEYSWIQRNGKLLTADPRTNKANLYDPLNPKANRQIFSMADDLIDAFNPDVFHTGLDEPWGFDAANLESNTEHLTTTELYSKIITEYHQHLMVERGIPMMIWADSFEPIKNRQGGLGATAVLDHIPNDIILAYWHYGDYQTYPPMWLFATKGFRITASTWKDKKAAVSLTKDAVNLRKKNKNMLGMIYTIWSDGSLEHLAPALDGEKTNQVMDDISDVINATKNILRE